MKSSLVKVSCVAALTFVVGALALPLAATPARAAAAKSAAAAPAAVPDSALASFDGGYVFPRDFTLAWWGLSPDQYPKAADAVQSRIIFLSQIVDRMMLEREMKKKKYALTETEEAELTRTRDVMVQNALFDEVMRGLPEPTSEDLEAYTRQKTSLAEIRFVTFADWDKARSWRRRLATGTPMSALDAAIERDGPAFAKADSFRLVAAEQIPDTLATVIWRMRPGQASEVHSFAGEPTIFLLRRFTPRTVAHDDAPGAIKLAYMRRQADRARELYRADLAAKLNRTFDEEGMAMLLRAHLLLPPRNDVDTLTGTPIMRPNIGLPNIAAADTGHAIARIRDQVFTIGEYLVFWGRVQPYARPEVRERGSLEAAVDRLVLSGEILRIGMERGYDKQPKIQAELDHRRTGYEMDHYFHDEIESKVVVTDAILRKYWSKDPTHYNDRASIESHIIVLERKSEADSILAQLKNGASFSELAKANSIEGTSGAEGGKVGLQYRGTQENAGLEDAMFATPIGGFGGPEKTPQGWVIWRIDASTPAVTRSYEGAKDMVERDYRVVEADRILRAKLDGLRAAAHVKLYEDRVTTTLGRGGPWED